MYRLLAPVGNSAIVTSSFFARLQTSSSLRDRYGCVVLLPPGVPRACPTHPHSFSARRSGRPAAAPLPSERRRPVLFLSLSLSLAPEPTPPVSSCDIRSASPKTSCSAHSVRDSQGQSGTVRDSQGQSGSLTVALLSPYCLDCPPARRHRIEAFWTSFVGEVCMCAESLCSAALPHGWVALAV